MGVAARSFACRSYEIAPDPTFDFGKQHENLIGNARSWRGRFGVFFLRPPGAVAYAAAAFAIALSCLIAILAARYRGAAFDEFATLRYSDPSLSLQQAWRELWPQETIPPLFYAVGRLAILAVGDELTRLRFINLPAMAAALAWMISVWRGSTERKAFVLLFATLAFCGKTTFTYFPYFRNYYWQWAAETIFVGAAVCDRLDGRKTLNPWFIAATPLLFWLHQMTALYAAAFAVWLAWEEASRRQWARLFALLASVAIGLAPLAYFSWLQYGHAGEAYHLVDWIPARSRWGAVGEIASGIAMALGQNWTAALLLAWAWRDLRWPAQGDRKVIRALAVVLAGPTIAAIGIDAFKPIVVQRYFGMASIEVAALLALALAPIAAKRAGVIVAVAANALVFAIPFGIAEAIKQNYESGASIIASIVRTCPTTRVHAGSRQLDYRDALAFRYLSRRYGFEMTPSVAEIPSDCPALYWAEGIRVRSADVARYGGLSRAANAVAGLGLTEAELLQARTMRSTQGLIVAVGGRQTERIPEATP